MKNWTRYTLDLGRSGLLMLLLCLGTAFAYGQRTVQGTVMDEQGIPLIGATVMVEDTRSGTITDVDGNFELEVPNDNTVLLLTYVGKLTERVNVGRNSTLAIVMKEDLTQLSDIVVTATATPVRKIETTTAIEVISARQLERTKPESFAEAVTLAPGVFTNTSQGRRGSIVTRGFPDGSPTGGLVYTGILLDGIPTFGTPGKLPDAGFGFDLNVGSIEFVRGSAATLFGRSSAAGVLNMITRTGGPTLGGTARMTLYDNILEGDAFNYRADFNLNGPLLDRLRFNVGGWLLQDNGFRETGYDDHGGQVRANLDYLLPNNGSIRLYGLYSNFNFQNLTDIAVNAETLELADGWENTDTYQAKALEDIDYSIFENSTRRPVIGADGEPIVRSLGDALDQGSYSDGGHVGLHLDLPFGDGWRLTNKARYQRIENGTKYGFALSAFYAPTSVLRLYLDGDAVDTDFINELRLNKRIEAGNSVHNVNGGVYFSTIDLLPTTYSYLYFSSVNPDRDSIRLSGFGPPGAPAPATGGITRRGDYTEQVTSFFLGDEMKFNETFTVNIGARYDAINLDMAETKVPFDTTLTREESFSDWSASLGFNYLFSERSALYGNVVRAFRMPDYSAFTSLELQPNGRFLRAPDGIENNEVIFNTELGWRTGFGDLGIDLAGFFTNIDNRLASVFEDGILVSKPLGQNQITGAEASLTYAPSAVRGLLVRTSLTLQNGRFRDFNIPVSRGRTGALNVNPTGDLFGNTLIDEGDDNYSIDLEGNRIPGVPNMIWNSIINYDSKFFGVNFSSNVNSGRFADATNIIDLGTLTILNAGAYAQVRIGGTNAFRVGVQAKNLTNATNIQGIAGVADNDIVLSTAQTNPTFAGLLTHGYVQLPRRILFTLSYDF